MRTKIAILFGGKSVEHEVSVISGIQAYMNINDEKYEVTPVYMTKENQMYIGENIGKIQSYKNIKSLLASSERVSLGYENGRGFLESYKKKGLKKKTHIDIDIVFPVVHGTNVEDGALQGYLKTIGIPFVGCDVTAAALGMDKYVSKVLLKENGIPVLDAKVFTLSDYEDIDGIVEETEKRVGYPAIVKPVNLGSSVGISVAKNRFELLNAIDDAFVYSTKILIEHAITNLREINCAVLGNENKAEASECEEPMHTDDILSYEDKYVSNASKSGNQGMASVARKIPADLSLEERDYIRSIAVEAFKVLGCNGVARIDFMIDEETGKIYFNEINTIPGSLAFYLWQPVGLEYKDLLDKMIQLSLDRMREEERLTFSFDNNILSNASFGGTKGAKI